MCEIIKELVSDILIKKESKKKSETGYFSYEVINGVIVHLCDLSFQDSDVDLINDDFGKESFKSSKEQTLSRFVGVDEYGFALLPKKFSNVQVSRMFNGERMGCSYCFPHGFETVNSTPFYTRTWKHYRKTQYKMK